MKKINTKHEKNLLLEAEKNSKPITLDNIKEMLENKKNNCELYEEIEKEYIEKYVKNPRKIYIGPEDEVNEFKNDNLDGINIPKPCEGEKIRRYD